MKMRLFMTGKEIKKLLPNSLDRVPKTMRHVWLINNIDNLTLSDLDDNATYEVEFITNQANTIDMTYEVYNVYLNPHMMSKRTNHSHEFKAGDCAMLKIDYAFTQGSGVCLISKGAEVRIAEIVETSDGDLCVIKYNNAESVIKANLLEAIVDIRDCVKTFQDAYNYCCKYGYDVYTSAYNVCKDAIENDCRTADVVAYLKLRIIAAALNDGWHPSMNELAYFPIFRADGSVVIENQTADNAGTSKMLLFKTYELAYYAATQFTDIYEDIYGYRKGDKN